VNHRDHVDLIRRGITRGGNWADFGSGRGAFTLALRDLAGPDVNIWSVDRDARSLEEQRRAFDREFPNSSIQYVRDDFTRPLMLPPLDGILAANAIHFATGQAAVLRTWRSYLKPDGRILLVEYDTDSGNQWVPHPISFDSLAAVAREAEFNAPELIGVHPSRYHDRMYAAVLAVESTNLRDDETTRRQID
jgi:SAM-dependent methyltransferase